MASSMLSTLRPLTSACPYSGGQSLEGVAKSTFSVYIIHVTVHFYNFLIRYDRYDNNMLEHYQYPFYLSFAMGGVLCVFVLSILYDKLRSLITDPLYNGVIRFVK